YINSGQNTITIDVSGTGQLNSTLNAGAFNRSVGSSLNFNATPNGTSGGIPAVTTTTGNGPYGIVGGWMTIGSNDFVTVTGGNLGVATYATKNDETTWATNDN